MEEFEDEKNIIFSDTTSDNVAKIKDIFPINLHFEFFQNVLDILTWPGIPETLLLDKVDLVIQLVQLFKEFSLSDRGVQNVTETHTQHYVRLIKIQAADTVQISILLICFCSFDLFCPLLEKYFTYPYFAIFNSNNITH